VIATRILSARSLAAAAVVAVICILFPSCSNASEGGGGTLAIAVDRTSIAQMATWPSETGAWAQALTEDAMAAGVEKLVILSIGPSASDTGKLAEVDLRLDCEDEDCAQDKALLMAGVAKAVGTVADTPLEDSGTDLVAALITARGLCGSGPCTIAGLTDGLDKTFFGKPVDGEHRAEIVHALSSALQSVAGASVELVGVGANPESEVGAAALTEIWKESLANAGVTKVTVVRAI
jgi:hypothetical protein